MKSEHSYPIIRAVIPAGGVGARAAATRNGQAIPKQYQLINGKTMLLRTVEALLAHQAIHSVHIGVAADDDWISQLVLPSRCYVHRTGGKTRADTVLNTIRVLPKLSFSTAQSTSDEEWVLVHDAARPGLPLEALDRLIKTCLTADTGGILALPVGDTVKRQQTASASTVAAVPVVNAHETSNVVYIDKTISRDGLWLAQTPQLFKKSLLEKALTEALAQGFAITDEASAIEFINEKSLLVKGHWRNLKVTWPEDFELVNSFLV